MASNGNLPSSMLTVVPPGRLERNAAAAWNAGPGKAGCKLARPQLGLPLVCDAELLLVAVHIG